MSTHTQSSLSPYPIQQLFPSQLLGSVLSGKARNVGLHFLIAHKRPFNEIEKCIQKIKKKSRHGLNFSSEKKGYNLTPLAVCVLVNDLRTAALLIDNGADPTIHDLNGWTPFHHAVITGNQDMLNLLKTAKNVDEFILQNLRNLDNANYQDLENLLRPKIKKPNDAAAYIRQDDGTISPSNASLFRELTGALYCDDVVITRKTLINEWIDLKSATRESECPAVDKFLIDGYKEYLENPPRIFLGKDPSKPEHGWDVYVDQDIEPLQGITIYAGEVIIKDPESTEYLLGKIDGKRMRNLGPMINDGFPNCMFLPVIFKGFCYPFIVAIRKIKRGERLLWNYGTGHKAKLDFPHFELETDELENYARKGSLENDFKEWLNFYRSPHKKLNPRQYLPLLIIREKISYLLETPTAVLYLLSKGLFPDYICTILYQSEETLKEARFSVEEKNSRFEFATDCLRIKQKLKTYADNEKKELVRQIQELLLNWSQTRKGVLLINVMRFFYVSLDKNVKSLEDWNEFNTDLNDYLCLIECVIEYVSKDDTDENINASFKEKINQHIQNLSKEKKEYAINYMKESIRSFNGTKSQMALLSKMYDEFET